MSRHWSSDLALVWLAVALLARLVRADAVVGWPGDSHGRGIVRGPAGADAGGARCAMTDRPRSSPAGPERERGAQRRLAIPILVAVVLVATVMALVFLIVQPWEASETFQRDVAPTVTVTP